MNLNTTEDLGDGEGVNFAGTHVGWLFFCLLVFFPKMPQKKSFLHKGHRINISFIYSIEIY
jgi:hypothetical protein